MRSNGMRCIVISTCLSLLLANTAGLRAAEPTAKEVLDAISMGKDFLISQQDESGRWNSSEYGVRFPSGVTSLAVLALINAGMSATDEPVKKGLAYLRSLPTGEPNNTYEAALLISALVAANAGERDKAQILRMVHQL